MAKKSQTKARRNNTRTGRSVVNFYNNGTANIDGRQNRSQTYKPENHGCTFNYPHHSTKSLDSDYFDRSVQIAPEELTHVVELYASENNQRVKSCNRTLKVAASVVIGLCVVLTLIKSNHKK